MTVTPFYVAWHLTPAPLLLLTISNSKPICSSPPRYQHATFLLFSSHNITMAASFENAFAAVPALEAARPPNPIGTSPPAAFNFDEWLNNEDSDDEAEGSPAAEVGAAIVEDPLADDFALLDIVGYGDLRDDKGHSKAMKESNALKHLNCFLRVYAQQCKSEFVRAEDLDFDGTAEDIKWWDSMIGCFFGYLATSARSHCDPTKERLSYSSATGYASSIKAYYENKFRTHQSTIPVFRLNSWRKLRTKLLSSYEEESRNTGKSLANPHVASTKQDRHAIALGCMWLNNPAAAEFWHLNNTMTQFSGRGSEVALNKREHLSAVEINELHFSYHVIESKLQRQKHGPESHVQVFPSRESVHEDYYFSLVYMIIMLACDFDYLFPMFADKAAQKTDSKSDSKVSGLWSKYFQELFSAFECLREMLNACLTSHHGKKGSNQKMADTPSVSGLAQIFRSGWVVRGFHSLFDYVVGSKVMSNQAGKAVSGWTSRVGDTIVGGQPPVLSDITTAREQVAHFVDLVFINDVNKQWPQDIRNLLVASLLRHYDEFCLLIQTEPSGKFTALEKHHFVCSVKEKLNLAAVSDSTFEAWKKEVKIGFFNRNLPALPIQNFPRYLGDHTNQFHEVIMDPRCFVDQFNSLAAHYQALHATVAQQQTTLNNLHGSLSNLREDMSGLRGDMNNSLAKIESMLYSFCDTGPQPVLVSPSESPLDGSPYQSPKSPRRASPSTPPKSPSSPYVKSFSVSVTTLGNAPTLADTFFFFFAERAKDGYAKYMLERKASKGTKDRDHRTVPNKFTRIKSVVKFMLRFCDTYPPDLPNTNKASDIMDWRSFIRSLGTESERRIRNLLYKDTPPDKPMVRGSIACSAAVAVIKDLGIENPEHEGYKPLPPDTPESIVNWFGLDELKQKKRRTNKRKAHPDDLDENTASAMERICEGDHVNIELPMTQG